MKKSDRTIEELRKVRHWQRGLRKVLWKLEHRLTQEKLETHKEVMNEVMAQFYDIDKKLGHIFKDIVGSEIVHEVSQWD